MLSKCYQRFFNNETYSFIEVNVDLPSDDKKAPPAILLSISNINNQAIENVKNQLDSAILRLRVSLIESESPMYSSTFSVKIEKGERKTIFKITGDLEIAIKKMLASSIISVEQANKTYEYLGIKTRCSQIGTRFHFDGNINQVSLKNPKAL